MENKKLLLKGLPASAGKTSGKVKIILSPKQIDKISKGEILVTVMTNPLFVPAMRKAVAIITDKGGQLCHAAIVSREFGIPCVVGTEQATKKLKDGEEVFVDGREGKVYSK
jgi:pyruvate,water dikinase